MKDHNITRRTVLGGMSTLALTTWTGFARAVSSPAIFAYRNPGCGCCEKWAEQLKAAGFDVSMQDDPDLSARRAAAGVPGAGDDRRTGGHRRGGAGDARWQRGAPEC